jgi:hypothetical protein
MNARRGDAWREELLARCRRERDELALLTTSASSLFHARDALRTVRLLSRLLRLFSRR